MFIDKKVDNHLWCQKIIALHNPTIVKSSTIMEKSVAIRSGDEWASSVGLDADRW
jgi:hypothetical protein